MQECFDPVIDQILALVEQQVKDTADSSYPEIKVRSLNSKEAQAHLSR